MDVSDTVATGNFIKPNLRNINRINETSCDLSNLIHLLNQETYATKSDTEWNKAMLVELNPSNSLFKEEQDLTNTKTTRSSTIIDVSNIEHAFLHVPYHHHLDIDGTPFDYNETLYGDYINVCITACNSPV